MNDSKFYKEHLNQFVPFYNEILFAKRKGKLITVAISAIRDRC